MGCTPTEEKVTAIKEAPKPKNVSELRAFLGIINYYHRFLPNLSTKLAPLHELLQRKTKWKWKDAQDEAFQSAKDALQADSLLVHFDPAKPIVLACDASQYGLGAVLSHVISDGHERPIAYVSRTLNAAEKNYSQVEKEGLAIVFGVKKFHNYIYGREFETGRSTVMAHAHVQILIRYKNFGDRCIPCFSITERNRTFRLVPHCSVF